MYLSYVGKMKQTTLCTVTRNVKDLVVKLNHNQLNT